MNDFKRFLRYASEELPAKGFSEWQLGAIHGAMNYHEPEAWKWLEDAVEKHEKAIDSKDAA